MLTIYGVSIILCFIKIRISIALALDRLQKTLTSLGIFSYFKYPDLKTVFTNSKSVGQSYLLGELS